MNPTVSSGDGSQRIIQLFRGVPVCVSTFCQSGFTYIHTVHAYTYCMLVFICFCFVVSFSSLDVAVSQGTVYQTFLCRNVLLKCLLKGRSTQYPYIRMYLHVYVCTYVRTYVCLKVLCTVHTYVRMYFNCPCLCQV